MGCKPEFRTYQGPTPIYIPRSMCECKEAMMVTRAEVQKDCSMMLATCRMMAGSRCGDLMAALSCCWLPSHRWPPTACICASRPKIRRHTAGYLIQTLTDSHLGDHHRIRELRNSPNPASWAEATRHCLAGGFGALQAWRTEGQWEEWRRRQLC